MPFFISPRGARKYILQNKNQTMINITASISQAFFDHHHFVPFYDLLNSFFLEDKIGAIHDAKTISVGVECAQLQQTYGFDFRVLYECSKDLFTPPSEWRLSQLIDLTDCQSFQNSVKDLNLK